MMAPIWRNKYRNPFRKVSGLGVGRIDMGVDYSAGVASPVYAVAPGVISTIRTNSGWPGGTYIAYHITTGPAKGLAVYFAEHVTPNPELRVGSTVNSFTVLGHLLPGFPNCEMGWDSGKAGYDLTLAVTEGGGYNEGDLTACGMNFARFVHALGAPMALTEGRSISGHVPDRVPVFWKKQLKGWVG